MYRKYAQKIWGKGLGNRGVGAGEIEVGLRGWEWELEWEKWEVTGRAD